MSKVTAEQWAGYVEMIVALGQLGGRGIPSPVLDEMRAILEARPTLSGNFKQWFDGWVNPHASSYEKRAQHYAAQAAWLACAAAKPLPPILPTGRAFNENDVAVQRRQSKPLWPSAPANYTRSYGERERLLAADMRLAAQADEVLTFDDVGFGYSSNGKQSITRRLDIPRPPGLTSPEWYDYAGLIVRLATTSSEPQTFVPTDEPPQVTYGYRSEGDHFACNRCGMPMCEPLKGGDDAE